MRTCSRNEIIFRQGDFAGSMFDITAGSVGIYVAYGTENENRLAVLKAGQFLGEMGLIEQCPRSADAVALEDGTNVAEITLEEYGEYFEKYPEKILRVLRMLSGRIRETDEKYMEVCRTIYENEQAGKGDKDENLNRQLDSICKEYGKFNSLWLN